MDIMVLNKKLRIYLGPKLYQEMVSKVYEWGKRALVSLVVFVMGIKARGH